MQCCFYDPHDTTAALLALGLLFSSVLGGRVAKQAIL